MEERINIFKALWLYKGFLLILSLLGFLVAYFVTDYVVNQISCYYEFEIQTEVAPNLIFSEDYANERLKQIEDYNNWVDNDAKNYQNVKVSKVSLSSGYDYVEILSSAKYEEKEDNVYIIRIKQNRFKTTFVSSKQEISEGITKCRTNMTKLLTQKLKYYDDIKDSDPTNVVTPRISVTISNLNNNELNNGFNLVNYNNPFIYGAFSAGAMFIISIGLFFIMIHGKNKDYFTDISDNETIFKTPFHKLYWKNSVTGFKNVKDLSVIAILFAMMLVCKLIPIPTGFGNLGLSFTYLFFSVISLIYGPVVGIVVGLLSDVLGYFINSGGGAFFPGYTLDAMAAGFMYGICFYKTKLTFAKCLYARLFVNLVVNVIFGSLWYAIINGLSFEAYQTYIAFISLPKNLLFLLPQTILLFIVLKAVMRPLSAFGYVDEKVKNHVTLF